MIALSAIAARPIHLPTNRTIMLRHLEYLLRRFRNKRRMEVRLRIRVAYHRRTKHRKITSEQRIAPGNRLSPQRFKLVH